MALFPSLTPKDGRCVRILLICRVSSPGNGKQDIRSLDDQEQMLRRWVAEHIGDNVEIIVIAGHGSGERLDRKELAQAEEALEIGSCTHPDNIRRAWCHARDWGLMKMTRFGRNAVTGGEKSKVVVPVGEKLPL